MIWQVGEKLQGGRYEIKEIINEGRLSVTYRAETPIGKWIVIKAPNDKTLSPPEFDRLQQAFVLEAYKLSRCRHPYIVQTEYPFQEGGKWCIPMEYIEGITLDKRNPPISETEALKYIHQIGQALMVVHQERLYHRDVNPTNIMLRIRDGQSEAVLIDFGLARGFDFAPTETRREDITQGYSAPELYSRHQPRGAYTDVYSLGATLFNLLTGKIPPDAEERAVKHIPILFPNEFNQRIKDAILKAMELEPHKRSQSVQEWLSLLKSSKLKRQRGPIHLYLDWRQVAAILIGIATVMGGLGALVSGLADGCELLPRFCPNSAPASSEPPHDKSP